MAENLLYGVEPQFWRERRRGRGGNGGTPCAVLPDLKWLTSVSYPAKQCNARDSAQGPVLVLAPPSPPRSIGRKVLVWGMFVDLHSPTPNCGKNDVSNKNKDP